MTLTRTAAITAVAALIGAGAALAFVAPASAATVVPPGTTIAVGSCATSGQSYATATTIQGAVDAATDGATIFVCPGTYAESVTITKNVTLLGAQHGVDARTGRADAAAESIITAANVPLHYAGAATSATVDGFTLQTTTPAAGETSVVGGVEAHAHYTFVNNIVDAAVHGLNFFGQGGATLIQHNRFTGHGADAGYSVGLTSAASSDVTVSENAFAGNGQAINVIQGVDGLTVKDNTSTDDENFLVANTVTDATVSGNTVSRPAGGSGTAILLGGANHDVTVSGNTIGGAPSDGIRVSNEFGSGPSDAITISGNSITGRNNGIHVAGGTVVTGVTVTGNTVTDSATNGLWVESGSGYIVSKNIATGSRVVDCRDDTKGTADDGTADTWTTDAGATSTPSGLCTTANLALLQPATGTNDGDAADGASNQDGTTGAATGTSDQLAATGSDLTAGTIGATVALMIGASTLLIAARRRRERTAR